MNHTRASSRTHSPRRRAVTVGVTSLALCASVFLAACSKSSSPSSSGGSSATTSSSGGSSNTMSAASWATSYCTSLATFANGITAEQSSFNANNSATDAPSLKTLEVNHLNTYLSLTQTALGQLRSGGTPDIPDGSGYVSGYEKAFGDFQSAVQSALGQANALDTTEDATTFNSDLSTITDSVNTAFSTFQSDWNGVDAGFTNPGDNPLVSAMNNDSNCNTFRSAGSSSSTTTTAAGQ